MNKKQKIEKLVIFILILAMFITSIVNIFFRSNEFFAMIYDFTYYILSLLGLPLILLFFLKKNKANKITVIIFCLVYIVSLYGFVHTFKEGETFFKYENDNYSPARFIFSKMSPYAVMVTDTSVSPREGSVAYLLNLKDKSLFFIPKSEKIKESSVSFSPSGTKLLYKNSAEEIFVLDLESKKFQKIPPISFGQYSFKEAVWVFKNRYFFVNKDYMEGWVDDNHRVFSCSKELTFSFSYCIYSLPEGKVVLETIMPKIVNGNAEPCLFFHDDNSNCKKLLGEKSNYKIIGDGAFKGFDGYDGTEIILKNKENKLLLYRSMIRTKAIYRIWNGDWLVDQQEGKATFLKKIYNL